jgi:NADP-dependent 3-hydroxy acid dehydrogenase YdfG
VGYRLVITGRRGERLQQLAQQLKENYAIDVFPLCFDIRDKSACEQAIQSLPEDFQKIDLLVKQCRFGSGSIFF